MRKYLPYILILIALTGIFSPVLSINAAVTSVPNVTITPSTENTKYQLLTKLPDGNGGEMSEFDTKNGLGEYINIIIKLAIGISAVLAVVMIVIGGIEYMGSELISEKADGKSKINNAILGLLIALGAWALLNTINGDLLNSDVKIDPAIVTVTLQEDRDSGPPSLSAFNGTIPDGPVAGCTTGVKKSKTTGIVSCSTLSGNLDKMIADAKQSNLIIWAGGFRTLAEQTALRRQNCGGDTTNPNAKCNPLTALPGTSRHESGLALDMTCGGQTIQTKDNSCFLWLKANASKYGLQNLIGGSEPWHWSTDGH